MRSRSGTVQFSHECSENSSKEMWNFPLLCYVVTGGYLVMPRTSSRSTWMTDDSGTPGNFQNFHKLSCEPQDQDSLGKKTMRDQNLPLLQEPALQWNIVRWSAEWINERKESLWPLLHWGQANDDLPPQASWVILQGWCHQLCWESCP